MKYDPQVSKFLSYVLRHRPESIGITLDKNGWSNYRDLLSKTAFTRDEIEAAVEHNEKKRFEFNEDRTKIRAVQGHSVEVDLELKKVHPPLMLYHGTVMKALDEIMHTGLKPMSRHHVHLSEDPETATDVGERRGKPIILEIWTREMPNSNFYISNNGVYLVDHVPVEAIMFHSLEDAEAWRNRKK